MNADRHTRATVAAGPPPFLLGTALVFWGWQTGRLGWGIGLAALLEATRFIRLRLEVGQRDFERLWNFCTVAFLATALYLFLAREGLATATSLVTSTVPGERLESLRRSSQAMFEVLRWLPVVFFLFVFIHALSRTGRLPWRTFSLYYQRKAARRHASQAAPGPQAADAVVHPGYPYLLLVLLAASATRERSVTYFPGLALLAGYGLWFHRPNRVRALAWGGALAGGLALGFAAQLGLLALLGRLENLEALWIQRLGAREFDSRQVQTALGALGKLKFSGRIILRVRAESGPPPNLLREAAFTRFQSPVWSAVRREFQPVPPESDDLTWRFRSPTGERRSAIIDRYTRDGAIALALPEGTFALRELAALSVETNRLGAARVTGADRLVTYRAEYHDAGGFDGAPDDEDRAVDTLLPADAHALEAVVQQLDLRRQSPDQALDTLRRFFAAHFAYSTYPAATGTPHTNTTPLAAFLLEHRRGHCEYFATATTLLLRAAGIPARYAVGYAVAEPSGAEYVVRDRHAHAWSLASLAGRWQVVDNTPADWSESERRNARFWEPVYDALSSAWRTFSRWRQTGGTWRFYVLAAGLAALGFIAYRQLAGSRWRRAQPDHTRVPLRLWPGLDSEFYFVERRLAREFGRRDPGEPLARWLRRVAPGRVRAFPDLERLLWLHYRYRFDPAGLTPDQRADLRRATEVVVGSSGDPAE